MVIHTIKRIFNFIYIVMWWYILIAIGLIGGFVYALMSIAQKTDDNMEKWNGK